MTTTPPELKAPISAGLLSCPLTGLKPAEAGQLGRLIAKLGLQ